MNTVYSGAQDPRLFKDLLGTEITRLLEEHEDAVYLDADLMSCIGTAGLMRAGHPRAINVGIAEANMMGVACGLAASGLRPIAHTFGCFASRRSFDQVFLSGGYAGNPLTVIGTDPGVCAAFNGGTHMPFEDMALYRAIPGATVVDVSDAAMLTGVLEQLTALPGVKYLRVGRKGSVRLYEDGTRFDIGRAKLLREGSDVALIACGIMTAKAMAAAQALSAQGVEAAVVDMFTVKPLDEEIMAYCAKTCGAVVAAENHNKIGGLTSAVCDALAASCPVPVETVAVEDVYGEVGPQDYLEERFGLTAERIVEKALRAVARKRAL